MILSPVRNASPPGPFLSQQLIDAGLLRSRYGLAAAMQTAEPQVPTPSDPQRFDRSLFRFPDPPRNPQDLPDWVETYLRPRGAGPAHRAHQFTLSDLTYPFVRDLAFGALPDPRDSVNRRYSLIAGLLLTRPGDLIFFFQFDHGDVPPPKTVEDRRGLRGIYRIVSDPFADHAAVPHAGTGYGLIGECPSCGYRRSVGREYICGSCGSDYPNATVNNAGRTGLVVRQLLLPNRFLLEPICIFKRSLGDNRAYGDLSDPGIIWTGRHDNQMGAGKGSSTRQLLPEEAGKLARLMLAEPGQTIDSAAGQSYSPADPRPITHESGVPVEFPAWSEDNDCVAMEFQLLVNQARTVDQPGSSLGAVLGDFLELKDLEFVCSELPWGYTADEADFAWTLASADDQRYRGIILENKQTKLDNKAVAQVSLYAPWAAQVFTQNTPGAQEIEIVPVLVGRSHRVTLVRPTSYTVTTSYLGNGPKQIHVRSPLVLHYEPDGTPFRAGDKTYVPGLRYVDFSTSVPQVQWRPPPGSSTTGVELLAARDAMVSATRLD